MIEVLITNQVVGRAWLYERRMRQGKRVLVPAYLVLVICTNTGATLEFQVTRTASGLIFGESIDRYGKNGECPPSLPGQPYYALVSNTNKGTFCLRLYEPSLREHNKLLGQGDSIRSDILIHGGPAMSEGCLIVSGGQKGYRPVVAWFKKYAPEQTKITVTVLP